MNSNTTLFKVLINTDRLFNVLTGGDLGICFSTRCYINSKESEEWTKVMGIVDKIMFEKNHCKMSYEWEYNLLQEWLKDNKIEGDK